MQGTILHRQALPALQATPQIRHHHQTSSSCCTNIRNRFVRQVRSNKCVCYTSQRASGFRVQASAAAVETDVCIVGAGIIGVSAALYLLQLDPKMKVTLVESKELYAGATGAGQGYIWMIHRNPSSPAWKLAAHSKTLWEQLLATNPHLSPASLEWQGTGSMLVSTSEEESTTLQDRQKLLQAAGIDASYVPAAEARVLEPALSIPEQGGGLLVPGDSQISGRKTAAALLEECKTYKDRFTQLFHEKCTSLTTDQTGRVNGVETEHRKITASRGIIMAAGAWTGEFLAAQLSTPAWAEAVKPRRGHLLELPRPADMPVVHRGLMETGYTKHYAGGAKPATTAADVTFTATTSQSGTLLVGSSREMSGWDSIAQPEVVDSIMQHAVTFLPGLSSVKTGDISVRVGLRPFAASGPIIGPVPGVDGLLVATGHEGSGLTLGPATAQLLCEYVFGGGSHALPAEVVDMVRPKVGLS